MPKKIIVYFAIVIMSACGYQADCPDRIIPDGPNLELPPAGGEQDETLRINRSEIWDDDQIHEFKVSIGDGEFNDFCVTIHTGTVDRVTGVYGQILNEDGQVLYNMEMGEYPGLTGVFCHYFRPLNYDWDFSSVATFRGWIIDKNRNWNYRDINYSIETN